MSPRHVLAQALQDLTADLPQGEVLARLMTLAPTLAGMDHLEVEAVLSGLKKQYALRREFVSALRRDVQAARKAKEREARKARDSKDASAVDLSELEEARFLHPAIDFQGDYMSLGFRVPLPDGDTGLILVVSDSQTVKALINPEWVKIGEVHYRLQSWSALPWLDDVWGLNRFKDFLNNSTRPAGLYQGIKDALATYLDLPPAAYGLLAAWAMATYFAHLFSAFPFLHFFGPKETGKSKTLEAKRCLCFNAFKGRDISAAALGDTCEGQRGTVLIDQAERLGQGQDGHTNLIGLLADSYKKDGGKRRVVEMSRSSGRTVLEFSTYGPKAFASTKRLDPDLEDRCARIPMTRTRKRLPDLEGWEPVWAELRDMCYRFALLFFKEVAQAYQAIPGDGTRVNELWRPLGAVLQALDVSPEEVAAVREFFGDAVQETRHEPTGWGWRTWRRNGPIWTGTDFLPGFSPLALDFSATPTDDD